MLRKYGSLGVFRLMAVMPVSKYFGSSARVASMDLSYSHQTTIYVLQACHTEDAPDLIAIGGEHSVEIVSVSKASCVSVASFHIGTRVTAIAWSPRTVSPSNSDQWLLEYVP